MSDAVEALSVQQSSHNNVRPEALPFLEIVSGGKFRPSGAEPESPNGADASNPNRPGSVSDMSQRNGANLQGLEGLIAPDHPGQMPIAKDVLRAHGWEQVKEGEQAVQTAKLKDSMVDFLMNDGVDSGDTEQIGKAARLAGDKPEQLEQFAKNLEERLKKENPNAWVKVVDGKLVVYNPTESVALEMDPSTGTSVTRPVSSDQSGNAVVDHGKSVMVNSDDTFADVMGRNMISSLTRRGTFPPDTRPERPRLF